MNNVGNFQAYLNLANDLFSRQLAERDLSNAASQLPLFDEELLDQLAQYAEKISLANPRHSWAITQVANTAATIHNCNLFVQSKAAWYLGRASNHWGQPKRVTDAILHARKGFENLHEFGWIAACDWQFSALSWTKPNFGQTRQLLQKALDGLEHAEFDAYTPHCRLALAYAQILVGDFDDAKVNIEVCEAIFASQGDYINQARCWLNDASSLRRQSDFDTAYKKLEWALESFERWNAPIDAAKTRYQIALWYFLSARDYQKAEEYFKRASIIFVEHELDLWYAVCQNGLGQINNITGNLVEANRQLFVAKDVFAEHDIPGLMANNYNDIGQLEFLKGDFLKSLDYFKDAENIYHSIGSELSAAIALANQGNISALLGRFQNALNDLELAQKRYHKLKNVSNLAVCEIYLAKIWTDLNQYATSHKHLNQAEKLIRQINQYAMLGIVHNQRAIIFSLEGKFDNAITSLKDALDISRKFGTIPQAAVSERQLGEMLSRVGQPIDAVQLLMSAEIKFSQMGIVIEQAASLTSLGYYYIDVSATKDAENAFLKALEICQGIMPDIESRIYTGLGILAEERMDMRAALDHYRKALKSIVKLQHSFWQPALAGSYHTTSRSVIDKSIQLATKLQAHNDTLIFIENSKAQSLVKQIASSIFTLASNIHLEINDLSLEIQALQIQLRVSDSTNTWLQSSTAMKEARKRLIECIHMYDEQFAQIERKTSTKNILLQHPEFDLTRFRLLANSLFGESWAVLDYYITETALFGVLITAGDITVWETAILRRERMVLDICAKSRPFSLSFDDLKIIGNLLLPPNLQKYLFPATSLVIAPHQDLHRVPWAAIKPSWSEQMLVEVCIPVIVPSLQILQLLGQRLAQKQILDRKTGLLIGISDFQGVRPSLPQTINEIRIISRETNPESVILLDTNATWGHLINLFDKTSAQANGLSRFAFFHIASHISYDSRTGRLSSIALYDADIWLDQLRDLSPLPNLVTLSACNGTQGLIYQGDEHVGLATTCLLAGANTIVGSLWPILDTAATSIMTEFYKGFFAGLSPSGALAQSQRVAIKNGEELQNWAGFICLGAP